MRALKKATLFLLLLAAVLVPETRALEWLHPTAGGLVPPADETPLPGLYITVYDWGLGGVNCDGDCSTTALTTTGDELLGWTAACPSAWLGYITTTVVTIWGQRFWCIDAFGRPIDRGLRWIDGKAVYRIDLAFRPAGAHPWNQEYVPAGDWSVEWRAMAEFDQLRKRVVKGDS